MDIWYLKMLSISLVKVFKQIPRLLELFCIVQTRERAHFKFRRTAGQTFQEKYVE